MFRQFFVSILGVSIHASLLIVCILLIRKLSGGRCRRIMCLLWGLVLLRLMIPCEIPIRNISIPNPVATLNETIEYEKTVRTVERSYGESKSGKSVRENGENATETGRQRKTFIASETESEKNGENHSVVSSFLWLGTIVWLAGAVAIVARNIRAFFGVRKAVDISVERDGVWLCDDIRVPFVFGVLRPRIYVPSDWSLFDLKNAMAHERAHVRRKDNLWKLFYTIVVAVYWFNPLIWIAFRMYDRDVELACDAEAMSNMNSEERESYLTTFINCQYRVSIKSDAFSEFSDGSFRERLSGIVQPKKQRRALQIVNLICGIIVFGISMVACGNTTAKENPKIADFSIQTLVCYGNFAADIQNDGTVRITVIGDGALEINLEEVASWKNIVSLHAGFGVLYGIDQNGKMHVSAELNDFCRENVENGTTSENSVLAQIIQDYPTLMEFIADTELVDGALFEETYAPRTFLKKNGNLVRLDFEDGGKEIVLDEHVAMCAGNYYLRENGTVGVIEKKSSVHDGYEKLKQSEERFTKLAENNVGIFGLREDGSVWTCSLNYRNAKVEEWKNVVDLKASGRIVAALHADGHVSYAVADGGAQEKIDEVSSWKDIVAIATDSMTIVGKAKNGELCTSVIRSVR